MAKTPTQSKEIQFTAEEAEVLRLIATDWLNEGLMLPPYNEPMTSVLAKLGLEPGQGARRSKAPGAAASAEPDEPQFFAPTPNIG